MAMNGVLNRSQRLWCVMLATLSTLVLLSVSSSPARAQSQSGSGKSPDAWNFTVAPYLNIPWMDGKAAPYTWRWALMWPGHLQTSISSGRIPSWDYTS
jgi:hypothetical protein